MAVSIVVILVSTLVFFRYIVGPNGKQILKIYCAASLLFPLGKIEEAYEMLHPDTDVEIEGHGSIQVIRQVTELHQRADLLMVADYSLIPLMMYNSGNSNTSTFADWYVRFASNEIVLAYTDSSRRANDVNSTNWFSILQEPNVVFGFPNPTIDALGYRALMVIQLAEAYYGSNSIFHNLVTRNFDPPISSIPSDDNYTIIVPEILQPKGHNIVLRASSIQLVPLLESGSLDYCFLYTSNAKQYGLRYIEFPDEFNLGNPDFENLYEHIIVKFLHQRFATVALDRKGETIYYGFTIPKNAVQPDLTEDLVKYLISDSGRDIFESAWQQILVPSYTDNEVAIPVGLRGLVIQEPL